MPKEESNPVKKARYSIYKLVDNETGEIVDYHPDLAPEIEELQIIARRALSKRLLDLDRKNGSFYTGVKFRPNLRELANDLFSRVIQDPNREVWDPLPEPEPKPDPYYPEDDEM